MFDIRADLFLRTLTPTDGATALRVQLAVHEAFPGQVSVATAGLDLEGYAELGLATIELLPSPTPLCTHVWGGPDHDRLERRLEQGCHRVKWRERTFFVVTASWQEGYERRTYDWVVGNRESDIHEFVLDVARKTNEPREAILVFRGGCWQQSRDLYQATRRASFDDLVLPSGLKERIRLDFEEFLGSRSAYERFGLPWRRGVLFLGPPGNGKTHCVRALVKELAIPSLYVQSIRHRYETDEANLKRVFERARQLRPCVLVFEDIDAMINEENRSSFLNQLDGFDKNVGLVVVATTNHPERLDPAIVDRPSRFDRKYPFALPGKPERLAYLTLWREKLLDTAPWDGSTTEALVERTAGFSFAYLKELIVSSLMKAVSAPEVPMVRHLNGECDALRLQIQKGQTLLAPSETSDLEPAED